MSHSRTVLPPKMPHPRLISLNGDVTPQQFAHQREIIRRLWNQIVWLRSYSEENLDALIEHTAMDDEFAQRGRQTPIHRLVCDLLQEIKESK